MKVLIFLILSITYVSCTSKMENPLLDFKMGEDEKSWKSKIENNCAKGKLIQQNKNIRAYRYYFKNGKEKIFADVEYNSDGYNNGNLRIIKFDLCSDSIIDLSSKQFSFESSGSRKKNIVDKLLQWFIAYYGLPSDTFYFDNIKSFGNGKTLDYKDSYNRIFDLGYKEGSLIWEKDNFDIIFYRQGINNNSKIKFLNNPSDFGSLHSDTTIYLHSEITFRIKNYQSYLRPITDSIRNNFTPDSLLEIQIERIQWLTYDSFNYLESNKSLLLNFVCERKGKEEPRAITNIKFDLIITDLFDDELYRCNDIKHKFSLPFYYSNSGTWINIQRFQNYLSYNSNWETSKELEHVRNNFDVKDLKLKTNIISIVFEDGKILK